MARSALYRFESHSSSSSSSASADGNVTQQNIEAIIRLENDALNQRTLGERVADAVTRVAVKPGFFATHALIVGGWIVMNTWGTLQIDPPPYSLMTSAITIEALFVTLLVLVGQHHLSRISHRRAHLHLQIDLLAEQEMTLMLRMLERLADHFKLPLVAPFPQDAELKKTTDLDSLIQKIDSTLEQREKTK